MNYQSKVESILGVDIRVRSRICDKENGTYDPFSKPLIHKKINGQVITPLDVGRLWRNNY
ncbi:hypothetical protein [Bacillus sp. EB01]|uniref:hypothetical protein n=1 Tax=Bacillus sp. EB01 TaxID=1347086 RepID=UPI0005C6FD2F|nr:hypothetical protein [Bacillus sp. EB01]